MKCSNCEVDCKEYALGDHVVYYCDACWSFMTHCHKPCSNHNLVYVRYQNYGGSWHLKKQCFTCGQLEGRYYPKHNVHEFDLLPVADLELAEKFDYVDAEQWNQLFIRYEKKRKQITREKSLDKFLQEHNEYLRTPEWQKRRKLVLERDKHVCQSCLEKPATEVHHKSYRYWKNEPLFELISVCRECHGAITEMNRGLVDFSKIIKE